MTDERLAEEIELSVKDAEQYGFHSIVLMNEDAKKIIAALRRVPSDDPMSSGYIPLCAGHAETWFTGRDHLKDGMKATCVVCAFERPPSGEMVMLRERNAKLEAQLGTTYHGPWKAADAGAMDANGDTLYRMFKPFLSERDGAKLGCYECGYFNKTQAPLVENALNRAEAMLSAAEANEANQKGK